MGEHYSMSPIIELYIQGVSRREIAERCGLTLSGVYKHLNRRGVTKRAEKVVYTRLRSIDMENPFDKPLRPVPLRPVPLRPVLEPMMELYTQGMTRNEIAEILGITPDGVGMYLRRRGVTKRREMELYAKIRAKGARVSDLFDDPLC